MNIGSGTAQFRAPKTILGFFAILLAILASGGVCAIGVIIKVPALLGFVAPILIFLAVVFVVTLLGVFITAWKDPTILMLGQVSGEVYLEVHRQQLGDSSSGEYAEKMAFPATNAVRTIADKREDKKWGTGS